MSSMLFSGPDTIYSDDEVEEEVLSSDDDDNAKKTVSESKKKKSAAGDGKNNKSKKKEIGGKGKGTGKVEIKINFDDGNYSGLSYSNSNSNSNNDDEDDNTDDDGDDGNDSDGEKTERRRNLPDISDNIRDMPRQVERAERAVAKREIREKSGKGDKKELDMAYEMDEATEAAFFDTVLNDDNGCNKAGGGDNYPGKDITMFSQLNLSRPLLRGVEGAGYVTPTPVQAKVIPLALAGRDICASAVTGSGKTAAFLLPVLQRLLYRPKENAAIRVLVVTPTRELATQIYVVLQKLSHFTDITSVLVCGGKKDLRSQEAALRQRPDIIVCTPGRIIDHLRNSQSVTVDELDVLILDEVDRLLELGFQEEVEELVNYCPINRQTLLFSATMTPKVDDLAKLSLKKPVRVKTAGGVTTVAPRLIQEFVKLREDIEREAILASLVVRNFNDRVIVFFETKKDAHRFYIILKLLGVKACELHGDLTQTLRFLSLEKFRNNEVDVMVCTDVAARGLDIPGVQTVIQAEMPRMSNTYVHRVGRTARAGCGGRAVTVVSDSRRKVMKEILKGDEGTKLSQDGGQILTRSVAAAVIDGYIAKIQGMENEIESSMIKERQLQKIDEMTRDVEKVENLMTFQDEIKARPVRTWFQTETQKLSVREASREKVKEEEGIAKLGKDGYLRKRELTTAELARRDDYRLEGKDAKRAQDHRLSRVKRRRLEALKDDRGENDDGDDGHSHSHGDGDDSGDKPKAFDVKMSAKRAKVSKRETQKVVNDLSVSDISRKRNDKRNEASRSDSRKNHRPIIATGGLDADMREWGMMKSSDVMSKKQIGRLVHMKDELRSIEEKSGRSVSSRKHVKPTLKSFKSKGRYKRR